MTNSATGTTGTVDEYCHGNRIVAIGAQKTSIVDYAKGEVTVIDFVAGTYSVATFEQLAKVQPRSAALVASARPVVSVTAHPSVRLRRAAVAALVGGSYPDPPSDVADAVVAAVRVPRRSVALTSAAAVGESEEEYALPVDAHIRLDSGGENVEIRNLVVRVGSELPPPEKIVPPAGARLVESEALLLQRRLRELDGNR